MPTRNEFCDSARRKGRRVGLTPHEVLSLRFCGGNFPLPPAKSVTPYVQLRAMQRTRCQGILPGAWGLLGWLGMDPAFTQNCYRKKLAPATKLYNCSTCCLLRYRLLVNSAHLHLYTVPLWHPRGVLTVPSLSAVLGCDTLTPGKPNDAPVFPCTPFSCARPRALPD